MGHIFEVESNVLHAKHKAHIQASSFHPLGPSQSVHLFPDHLSLGQLLALCSFLISSFFVLPVRLRVHHKILIINLGLMASLLLGKGTREGGLLGRLYHDYQLSKAQQNFGYEGLDSLQCCNNTVSCNYARLAANDVKG